MRTLLLSAVGSCGILAPLAAQSTWKVHNGSLPGAHFNDLPAAVAAAAPNDTILVYHWPAGGTGGYYTAPTIDKPLTIIGFSVMPQAPSGSQAPTAALLGVLTITGIAAGERVVVSNCTVTQDPTAWAPPFGVHVTNCAGEVVLEDFRFLSGGLTGSMARIENSANVVLRGCDFLLGDSPIDVSNSSMLVTSTWIDHTNPSPIYFPGWPTFTQTADGMRVTNSNLTVVNSSIRGSQEITGYGAGYNAKRGVT